MTDKHISQRFKDDRFVSPMTLQIPNDVLDSLNAIKVIRKIDSYEALLTQYIGEGLRRDKAEINLKRRQNLRRKNFNPHIGRNLNVFLRDEGIYEDTQYSAIRDALASHIKQELRRKKLTKTQMCKRLKTSPTQLECLLDPKKENVTIRTLREAAVACGRKLYVDLA